MRRSPESHGYFQRYSYRVTCLVDYLHMREASCYDVITILVLIDAQNCKLICDWYRLIRRDHKCVCVKKEIEVVGFITKHFTEQNFRRVISLLTVRSADKNNCAR